VSRRLAAWRCLLAGVALVASTAAGVRAQYQGPPACPRDTVYEVVPDPDYASCLRRILEQRSTERCPPDRSVQRCTSQPGAAEHLRCPRGMFLRDDRCWPIR